MNDISIVSLLELLLLMGSLAWVARLRRQLRKEAAAAETEIKRSEELEGDLTKISEQYRYLFEMTPSSIMLLDKEGRILDINPYHLTHISKGKAAREQFVGKLLKERQSIVNAGLSGTYAELLKGTAFDLKDVYFPTTTAGTEGYFNVKGAPLTKGGEVIGAIVVHEDITERIQGEAALVESRRRFKDMAELLPGTICEIDSGLKISYVNRAGLELFGYTRKEVDAGLFAIDLVHPEERSLALGRIKRHLQGEIPSPSEYRMLRRDGTEVSVLLGAAPLFSGDRTAGFRVSITDITHQKKLQAEVLRTEKLASIGILAGGLAHDLNNALQIVTGYISLAGMDLSHGDEILENLHEAEKASHIAKDLANRLATFSEAGTPRKRKACVAEILATAAEIALDGSPTEYTLVTPENLSEFEFDEKQMGQAFQNILTNARESMPAGGTIHIIAENMVDEEVGECVKVSVKDQGEGIAGQDIAKVFDPYFSTKQRGTQKGTGLGLSISYSIIRQHGGEVGVRSFPGRGTTVTVCLPTGEPSKS